jgi:hypothetical protein
MHGVRVSPSPSVPELAPKRTYSLPPVVRRSKSRSFIDQTTSLVNFHFDFKLVESSRREVRKVLTLSRGRFDGI